MGASLAGVCLMGVCLMGVHLVGVHLVGVHLVGVSYGRASLGMHLRDIYFMGMHRVRSFPHRHTPKSCVSISHGGNCSKNHVVERLRKLEVNFTYLLREQKCLSISTLPREDTMQAEKSVGISRRWLRTSLKSRNLSTFL